jgi:ABC-type lipoprotein release transport system permease subunit
MIRLAWRNLWRNHRRTLLTMGTVALATTILSVVGALMNGMADGSVRNATDTVTGEVEIHAPGYTAERSMFDAIEEPEAVLARLRVEALPATARSYGVGLAAHANKSAGASLWGVDPADERRVFSMATHLRAGAWLADGAAGTAVLGHKLAHSLGVTVGDEIVVVVQAADGSIGNELLRVAGILEGLGEGIDRTTVLIHRNDFDRLFVADGRIHEVVVNTRGAVPLATLEALVRAAAPGLDVRTWRQVLPMLSDMLEVMDSAMWVFSSVFLVAAGLGVLNTMLMATWERTHEFGVLKALGTPPWRLARDVAVEALVLAIVATTVGAVLGAAAAAALEHWGIDTRAWAGATSFGGVAFDPVWRASLGWKVVVEPAIVLWVTCVIAALYPAVMVARLRPVEALGRK